MIPPDLPPSPEPPPELPPLDLRRLVLRVGLGLLALFGVAWGAALLFEEAIEAVGEAFVARAGLPGVGLSVWLLDSSPIPLITEPIFLLALGGGLAPREIALAASLGALLASVTGYALGRGLGHPLLTRLFDPRRLAQAEQLVARYGFWGIALAALTPLPFGLSTWTAGALEMRLGPFLLGALFRVPKTLLYLWLVQQAWAR